MSITITKKQYAVLTYIYGDAEQLHEIRHPEPNIEYICVTDNKTLKSKTWHIVYEPLPTIQHNRLKFAYVKTHPFNYTNSSKVCIIDGSISVESPISSLMSQCDNGIMMKPHPKRNTLFSELVAWKKQRGLSDECATRYKKMATALHANIMTGPVYESCVMIWDNNDVTKIFGEAVFTSMLTLSKGSDIFLSNQLVMSLLLQSVFQKIPIKLLDQSRYFIKYSHKSDKVEQPLKSSPTIMNHKQTNHNIIDDITILSANFNTPDLTLHMIKSAFLQIGRTIPVCIIDNSTIWPMPISSNTLITVIDNTNFKHTPNYGQCSANHCSSIEYAMNTIQTQYILLCDTDVLFKPMIKNILNVPNGSYDVCGEVGWDKHPGDRLFPYCCIIDNHKKRANGISYFDSNRIMVNCLGIPYNKDHPPKDNVQAYFDTGASFLQDIQFHNWMINQINLSDVIVHKKGGTLHPDNDMPVEQWLTTYKHLWCNNQ